MAWEIPYRKYKEKEDNSDYFVKKRMKKEQIQRKKPFFPIEIEENMQKNEGFSKKILKNMKLSLNFDEIFDFYQKTRNELFSHKSAIISNEISFDFLKEKREKTPILPMEFHNLCKKLKKLKKILHIYHENIEIHDKILEISQIFFNLSLFPDEIFTKTMISSIKDILSTRFFTEFPKGTSFRIFASFWTFCMKIHEDIKEKAAFSEDYKGFLLRYFSCFLDVFYREFLENSEKNDDFYEEFNEKSKIFGFLLEIHDILNEGKTGKIAIIQQSFECFLNGFKLGLVRFLHVFTSKNTEKQEKILMKKIRGKNEKNAGFYGFFEENSTILRENRFFEYVFELFPYENQNFADFSKGIPEKIDFFGFFISVKVLFSLLLTFEFHHKNAMFLNDFLVFYCEKGFFNEIFPLKNTRNFTFSLRIFSLIFQVFGLETSRFFKIKEKLQNILISKDFSPEFPAISSNNWPLLQKIHENFFPNYAAFPLEKNSSLLSLEKNSSLLNIEKNSSLLALEKNSSLLTFEKNSSLLNIEKNCSLLGIVKNCSLLSLVKNSSRLNIEKNGISADFPWEIHVFWMFLCSFANEYEKTPVPQRIFFEKRVFSRSLCALKQYDKFHGDLQKNSEFLAFRMDFYLLNSLVFLFKKEEFLVNSFKFSTKFLRNYENSHFFVKQMMFNFMRNLTKIAINNKGFLKEKNGNFQNFDCFLKDLWTKFLWILNDFLDIGSFLKNFSINTLNFTENERILDKEYREFEENLNENLDFFIEISEKSPFLTMNFFEIFAKNAEKTSILWTFRPELLISYGNRLKSLKLLRILYRNCEEFDVWWEKYSRDDEEISEKEPDYEEILKEYQRKELFHEKLKKLAMDFLENNVFHKILELMNSM